VERWRYGELFCGSVPGVSKLMFDSEDSELCSHYSKSHERVVTTDNVDLLIFEDFSPSSSLLVVVEVLVRNGNRGEMLLERWWLTMENIAIAK
jgi:hypothetical protein